ncbi:MAG: helix-turn-helix domain-containing protein [Vicinamibacterales bacterium]
MTSTRRHRPERYAGELLTVDAAARRLSVPVSWIYSRVGRADCDLPHVRIGRYIRFEPRAIESYIEERRLGAGSH